MHERPTIPETITVHMGRPEEDAPNIVVPFMDYIKNVASSELYPTWPENALRANILAEISNALNRVFTKYYPILGYNFDITNSPELDQSFIYGRTTFDNINRLVEELITSYISRRGDVEPLYTLNCNGTPKCEGISLWGTVDLANQGLSVIDILRVYDGDDIVINSETNLAPIPGTIPYRMMKPGDSGEDIQDIQIRLNRIANNYPSIPKISPTDGEYNTQTVNAVMEFQRIFDLNQTGILDPATWIEIQKVYRSIKRLSDLGADDGALFNFNAPFPDKILLGEESLYVRVLQYYLAVVAQFFPTIPDVLIDGVFGVETQHSLRSFQGIYGLPITGIFDKETRDVLYNVYRGIINTLSNYFESLPAFAQFSPQYVMSYGMRGEDVKLLQEYIRKLASVFSDIPYVEADGVFGYNMRNAVMAVQNHFGLIPNGFVNGYTWDVICDAYKDIMYSEYAKEGQFGGIILSE
jgi:peptidoglycan hydrolase-like protein with peptidoglycan-binding domain